MRESDRAPTGADMGYDDPGRTLVAGCTSGVRIIAAEEEDLREEFRRKKAGT